MCKLNVTVLIFFLMLAISANSAKSEDIDDETMELLNLSLNQIMNVKVTSVSKKAEKLSGAAAAIYVITSDDIKKSGLQSIPEILRMAPGIQVTQTSTSRWSISARGFNGQFANKLLVLMDGRTIYTPIHSGVYWDQQDTIIEDIDRIEVIRGPGATLWGANAVNGVINIITKKADDTQGLLFSAGTGNLEKGRFNARYGGTTKAGLKYRSYLKYFYKDGAKPIGQINYGDDWHDTRGGFRVEKIVSDSDEWTLQGDLYSSRQYIISKTPTLTAPFSSIKPDDEETNGGNILFKWNHKHDDGKISTLQTYYDVVNRSGFPTSTQNVKTFDIDFQQIVQLPDSHEVTWGGSYRNIESDLKANGFFDFTPSYRMQHFFSSFIQDRIEVIDDTLNFTLGSKFEYNPFTRYEVQPSIRAAWTISPKQTVWGAISKAVKTPNRAIDEISLKAAGTPGGFLTLNGNKDAKSEKLTAYELGYRTQTYKDIYADLTVFYHDYDNLASNIFSNSLTAFAGNQGSGRSYGLEIAGKWDVNEDWNLGATYSFIDIQLDNGIESGVNSEGKTPRHQYSLRSSLKLPRNIQLNNQIYYSSKLPAFNIDEYVRVDSNIAWTPTNGVELSIIGQNLFDNYHPEFGANINEITYEVSRSILGKITFKY